MYPVERVLIEVDPAVSAGFINNRFDLEIHGWVVSSAQVEEVALLHDGALASRVQFGAPGPAAQVTLADGTTVTRQVFTLLLPRPRTAAGAGCAVTIAVQTASGQTHHEDLTLTADPLLPTQVRVTSGPTRPSAEYGGQLAPIVLFVERAAIDRTGYLQLVGWVVSLSTLATIQVFAGEERVSSPRLGTRRDDVAGVYPSYPNALQSGFVLSTPLSETARDATSIRAQAICVDGYAHELVVPLERIERAVPPPRIPPAPPIAAPAPPPGEVALPRQDPVYRLVTGFSLSPDVLAVAALGAPQAPPAAPAPSDAQRAIRYFCDVASLAMDGTVAVQGWAACAAGIAAVEVWLNDQRLGEAEHGLLREDVGEQFPNIPAARHAGFRFATRLRDLPEGEHRLRVVVRNALGDTEESLSVHVVERQPPPPIIEAPAEFRFEIDAPALVDGKVVEPVTARLTIEGWLLSRSGVAEISVWIDDQRIGEPQYGLTRQDVGAAFPDWPNALRSGYAFHCPPRNLRNGEHVVTIAVRANNGEELRRSFRIDVNKPEDDDEIVSIRRRIPPAEVDVLTEALVQLDHHPGFRLVLRQNGPIESVPLMHTFAALGAQAYRDWRMIALVEDADSATIVRDCLAAFPAELVDRVDVIDASATDAAGEPFLDLPFGANEAGGRPLLFGLLCPGDELGCDALIEFALAGGQTQAADLFYADELRRSPASRAREPFYKPDFSPDLLLSTNYVGRPWFATPALLARAEITPRSLLRDAEYDIVLRCAEQAAAVHHLPKLLCRRGPGTLDSPTAERGALRRAAVRRGIRAEVVETPVPSAFRFRRRQRASGKVSIIIPTCAAHGHIETCIRTLRDHTAYRNYEIVCADNIPAQQVGWKRWLRDNADKVVDMPEAFNWSRFNNLAVEQAAGEYLLFLNDDIEVIDPEWLDALLEHAQRPEVGITGARLLYPGRRVQHAGMFLATMAIARHAFRFAAEDEPGYFGLSLTQRNVMAVTGACMLVRRDVFDALGRFDEAHEVINNDVDFCLRAHQAGFLTVYTPYATLIHHEQASRDQVVETFDTSHFEQRWKSLFTKGDPYFSPMISRHADDYRPDEEAVERVFAGHPMFRAAELRRILVVKLDHIGDLITALPAIRRLKSRFPAASIHLLAARNARAFAEIEPSIDGFIEFEFFHARSELGQKDLTEEDYAKLRTRLLPYGFDLAIDLRKHPQTREILRRIPARYLAGYDHLGRFAFLDVALEWEGDKYLQRKRNHVTDDLLNLVEAVHTAANEDRRGLLSPSWPAQHLPDFLPADVRALFAKPVVAIHPGAGNVTKQWPVEHFSALTDLLTEAGDLSVVVVGGPDEAELAEQMLHKLARTEMVKSLAGRTSLTQLTELLACCVLYVGNDSGPKHIAAAVGLPTIGVHSGVIDPTEWAPLGQRAMALRRSMSCSPCYISQLEDCPRNLACLRHLEPVLVWEACRTVLPIGRATIAPYVLPAQPPVAQDVAAQPAPPPARRGRGRKLAAHDPSSPEAAEAAPTSIPDPQPVAAAGDATPGPASDLAVDMPAAPVETPPAAPAEMPPRGRRRAAKPITAAEHAAPDPMPADPPPPEPEPAVSAPPLRRRRGRSGNGPAATADTAASPVVRDFDAPPPEPVIAVPPVLAAKPARSAKPPAKAIPATKSRPQRRRVRAPA